MASPSTGPLQVPSHTGTISTVGVIQKLEVEDEEGGDGGESNVEGEEFDVH